MSGNVLKFQDLQVKPIKSSSINLYICFQKKKTFLIGGKQIQSTEEVENPLDNLLPMRNPTPTLEDLGRNLDEAKRAMEDDDLEEIRKELKPQTKH